MIGMSLLEFIRLKVDNLAWRPGKKEMSVLFLLENCVDKVAGFAEKSCS